MLANVGRAGVLANVGTQFLDDRAGGLTLHSVCF